MWREVGAKGGACAPSPSPPSPLTLSIYLIFIMFAIFIFSLICYFYHIKTISAYLIVLLFLGYDEGSICKLRCTESTGNL